MKIQVRSIHPNPYRNFDRNPLIPERTNQLVESINSTEFWDNIVVRPSPNGTGYELAYGHHRLEALKVAGIKTIDIPCKDLSDGIMVKMMADENLMQWGNSPAATNEAIEGARDFLESGLGVCETVEEYHAYAGISIPSNNDSYTRMKNSGEVGSPIIQKFLGKGWSLNVIVESLKIVNANRDIEKARLAEEAAESERAAQEKLQREQEAKQKAEEAKAAALAEKQAKAEAERIQAEATAKKAKADADRKKAQAQAKTAKEAENRAKKARAQADADAKAAAKAAAKASAEANKKRQEATKAHAAKNKASSRIDRNTFEGFSTQEQATVFARESARYTLTPTERVKLGAYIISQNSSKRQIPIHVKNWVDRFSAAGRKKAEKVKQQKVWKSGKTLDDVVGTASIAMQNLTKQLNEVLPYLDNIQDIRIKKKFLESNKNLLTVVSNIRNYDNAQESLKVVN